MFKKVGVGMAAMVAAIFCTAGTGVSMMAFSSVAAASTAMSVVPVTVLDGQGTSDGARPTVEVNVGNSPPVPVLLDTGSSGLHIFDNAVETGAGSGVTLTDQPANITYSGGHRFTGVQADAVVRIGPASTKLPVSFAYVEQASCIPSKPTCPASGGISGFEQSGVYGILGIGIQSSGGGVTSPILGMPRALGKRWSLHLDGASGSLVLGARLPARRSSTTIQMTEIGTSAGKALWGDSRLPLCVSVSTDSECVPALFDSGTYTMQISGPALDQAPTIPGTAHVVAGTPVSVSVSGSTKPFWTFSAGTIKSDNLLTVEADEGPFLNTGVQAFYDFTITYDDVNGQVRLSQ